MVSKLHVSRSAILEISVSLISLFIKQISSKISTNIGH